MPELTRKLRAAAESDDVEAIDALIKAGADRNKKNDAGNTALHAAVYRDSVGASRALLAASAFATQGMSTEPLRSISPCAKVATTQPMRYATPEAHDDVDRRLDRSRESAAVPSSTVRQGQGTRLHERTRRPGIRTLRRLGTSTGECAAR